MHVLRAMQGRFDGRAILLSLKTAVVKPVESLHDARMRLGRSQALHRLRQVQVRAGEAKLKAQVNEISANGNASHKPSHREVEQLRAANGKLQGQVEGLREANGQLQVEVGSLSRQVVQLTEDCAAAKVSSSSAATLPLLITCPASHAAR